MKTHSSFLEQRELLYLFVDACQHRLSIAAFLQNRNAGDHIVVVDELSVFAVVSLAELAKADFRSPAPQRQCPSPAVLCLAEVLRCELKLRTAQAKGVPRLNRRGSRAMLRKFAESQPFLLVLRDLMHGSVTVSDLLWQPQLVQLRSIG